MCIIPEPAPNLNFPAALTAMDFKTEIRKLEDQVAIRQDELRELEEAHRARPYQCAFMTTMRHGYQSSLRELHSQIETVRAIMQ